MLRICKVNVVVEYRELKYNEITKVKVDFIQYWSFEKKYKEKTEL